MTSQAPRIDPVETSGQLPDETTVVVIGGGIIGLTAALTLAERGVPVTVVEKGRLAGEQSSRNLGWVRKTNRHVQDLPLSMEAERLWQDMPQRVGSDVGYRQRGIMFTAREKPELEAYEDWCRDAGQLHGTDSRMVTAAEIDKLAPGSSAKWLGGIYTPSDGVAEPTMASSAIASAAIAKGAVIVENCAARVLSTAGGKVAGVVTERGEIRCDQVILAGGVWSRRFLGNMGISFYTLPLEISVLRTAPMEGPTEIATGASDFSFRKDYTGGYTIMHRAGLVAPITLDSFLLGTRYLSSLRSFWKSMRLEIGREMLSDLRTARHWKGADRSPFEKVRTKDPPYHAGINRQAMQNLSSAWPVFGGASVALNWAGAIDITPDFLPVISRIDGAPGLTLASGFSGHGFGSSPAAGQLAADLATGASPLVDPIPYRFDRFS